MQHTKIIIFILLFTILASCNKKVLNRPVDPVWDRVVCSHCGMAVSDQRYAAQIITKKGKHNYFDDIGCAIEWKHQHKSPVKTLWVKDAKDKSWLNSDKAYWSSGAQTPMGYGYSASSVKSSKNLSFSKISTKIIEKVNKRKSTNSSSEQHHH